MGLRDNQVALIISVLELVVNVLFSFWLVGRFGLVGIAAGTVLAYTFEKIGLCLYLYRRHGIGITRYTDMGWLSVYSLVLLASFILVIWIY
jgi:peptidoglycan biosynthesis protein MviN/MurJ (putative lipid II flippase)